MSCLSPAERRREKERRAGRRGRSRRGDREPLASLTSGGHRRVQSHNGRARGSLGRARLTGEQSQADVPRAARGGLHAARSTQRGPRSGVHAAAPSAERPGGRSVRAGAALLPARPSLRVPAGTAVSARNYPLRVRLLQEESKGACKNTWTLTRMTRTVKPA